MIGRWLHRRRVRNWAVLLLAPALALRLLVPDGFMAGAGEGGALTMQMCHGDARSSTVIRVTQGGESPAGHGDDHESPCVFAATAGTAPPPLAAIAVVFTPSAPTPAAARISAPDLRETHRTQSPRAPPSLA